MCVDATYVQAYQKYIIKIYKIWSKNGLRKTENVVRPNGNKNEYTNLDSGSFIHEYCYLYYL